jgi:hypothetical protein
MLSGVLFIILFSATVAQLAEHLICNQRVGGSIPFGGSIEIEIRDWVFGAWRDMLTLTQRPVVKLERYPSGQRGRAVNPLA